MEVWKQEQFARDYTKGSSDRNKCWFEYELDFPALLAMIPKNTQRVLDFGSGPGDFTNELAKYFPVVEGADYSPAMIKIASTRYPQLKFHIWDGASPFPVTEVYDVIFSKATIQFVEDLHALAKALRPILKSGGTIVFSAAHPFGTAKMANDYWANEKYEREVGSYGINATMIHRNFENYIQPFLDNDYILQKISELKIPAELAQKHNIPTKKLARPKRLNLSFRKI